MYYRDELAMEFTLLERLFFLIAIVFMIGCVDEFAIKLFTAICDLGIWKYVSITQDQLTL
jgi:hypothetical protein